MADVAQGKTATSSGSCCGQPASLAVDGNDSTRWAYNGVDADPWVRVDLASAYSVDSFRALWLAGNRFVNFRIEYSTDDVAWNTAHSVTAGGNDTGIVSFSAQTARYWRIIEDTKTGWPELATFQLFEAAAAASQTIQVVFFD